MNKNWHEGLIRDVEEAGRYITENAANIVGEETYLCDIQLIVILKSDGVPMVKVERTHPVVNAVI